MDALIRDVGSFLTGADESVGRIADRLAIGDRLPDDDDRVGGIFELIDTLVRTCGFFGLPRPVRTVLAGEHAPSGLWARTLAPIRPPEGSLPRRPPGTGMCPSSADG